MFSLSQTRQVCLKKSKKALAPRMHVWFDGLTIYDDKSFPRGREVRGRIRDQLFSRPPGNSVLRGLLPARSSITKAGRSPVVSRPCGITTGTNSATSLKLYKTERRHILIA